MKDNHYKWLDHHLQTFFKALGVSCTNGIIVAHGDKCYSYREEWEDAGIPFSHGVALYLLSYIHPYSKTCRETEGGWIKPSDWVISNYTQLSSLLPPA